MLLLTRPSDTSIRAVLDAQRRLPFSYAEVGAADGAPPPGYAVDRSRVRLGAGQVVFERACAALRRWEHIPTGWMRLLWPDVPLAPEATVGVLVGLPGLWALSACRVAYLIDEGGPVRRFGFGWGTLPAHVARGEERFVVEWRAEDDSVWYDIVAFSRPNHPLLRLGYPAMRLMQRRFARDSRRAMVRAALD
ncbi:MAG TPA: DUF1990 domain-containing protein [Roseiflexaceae bacterium]|nr:DUF1990 domain-containing protein [Roseiflexaceae bacterium]